MRHRVAHRKLGRTTEHRLSLLRNLTVSLIQHGRIRTTLAKAKELRPFAERLVTLGKKDSLHARRRALAIIPHKTVVAKLFKDISPRFSERPGGYTRILKLEPRQGDGAPMAFIEFVDYQFDGGRGGSRKADEKKPRKKKVEETKAAKQAEDEAADEVEEEEKPKPKKKKKTAAGSKKKTTTRKKKT